MVWSAPLTYSTIKVTTLVNVTEFITQLPRNQVFTPENRNDGIYRAVATATESARMNIHMRTPSLDFSNPI